jgi:hypothetical protein
MPKLKQLNLTIDGNLADKLTSLKVQTSISKRALLEQAIKLLADKYDTMGLYHERGFVNENFLALSESAMDRYGKTMKKLAE